MRVRIACKVLPLDRSIGVRQRRVDFMRITSLLTSSIPPWLARCIAKSPVALDNIQVAAPCPMSWEKMTGDERVRCCQECKLNVYNLSDMTRAEAERLIASREGRLCVRFYRRADGTILTRDCPRGLRALSERVSRIAGAVLAANDERGHGCREDSCQQNAAESGPERPRAVRPGCNRGRPHGCASSQRQS